MTGSRVQLHAVRVKKCVVDAVTMPPRVAVVALAIGRMSKFVIQNLSTNVTTLKMAIKARTVRFHLSYYSLCIFLATSMASGKWINGEWSEWSTDFIKLKQVTPVYLSECSAPCGGGTRRRQALRDGARPILEMCNTQECARSWTLWSSWSACSVTCGSGSQYRRRECNLNKTMTDDGHDCDGNAETIRVCQMGGCPYYTQWADWSPCSATCGEFSERTRARECKNSFNGPCEGAAAEREKCALSPCPHWAEWIEWDSIQCSTECGSGSKTRERECVNGEPNVDCRGIRQQIIDCTNGPCQEWSPWSRETSECSVTCGIGTKQRTRTCKPGICTNDQCCLGDNVKTIPCRGPPCSAETTAAPSLPETTTAPAELIFTNTSECELSDNRINLQCLNTECEIKCDSGYELVGAKIMNCEEGKWNQSQPQCARQCSDDVDILLIIPANIDEEEALYVRTLLKKIVTLFGEKSVAKFSAVFVSGESVYWIWEFEDYATRDRLIELTDRIRPGSVDDSNQVPADLTRFLFNMSGRESPNIVVNFDTVLANSIKYQDE